MRRQVQAGVSHVTAGAHRGDRWLTNRWLTNWGGSSHVAIGLPFRLGSRARCSATRLRGGIFSDEQWRDVFGNRPAGVQVQLVSVVQEDDGALSGQGVRCRLRANVDLNKSATVRHAKAEPLETWRQPRPK